MRNYMKYVMYDADERNPWFSELTTEACLRGTTGPSSCNTSLTFWLGIEAVDESEFEY